MADDEPAFSVASVLVHEEAFARPHDIELSGDFAFVPGKGGSLAIVDISDPAKPSLCWHRRDPQELDEAETVLVDQDRLFLGTHDFHSIDVSNPAAPVFTSKVSDRKRITRINGMVRRGDTVFAASKHGWLDAFDISDPDNPVLAGAFDLRTAHDIGYPHDVDLYGDYAVVVDPHGFGRDGKPGRIALVRVFDAKSKQLLPADRWKIAGILTTPELAGANRVEVSGRYAFVGASTRARGGRFIVVDLTDPVSLKQVAHLPFAVDDGWGPNGLTVAGDVVFLAGGHSVEAMGVSNPAEPVKLASQQFPVELANVNPRYKGGGDSGHDLVYRDGYLFVTGQNDHCLLILRIESGRIRQSVASRYQRNETKAMKEPL
jgi:hypothetical protein